jgi:Ran GTPase-activating protein (RanGAP) involved in mRNA processing and transport
MSKFDENKFDEKLLSSRQCVDLSGMNINEKILQEEILPKLKKNPNLRELNLANNQIGDGGKADIGVYYLVQILKPCTTIRSLNLKNNNIGFASFDWLKGMFVENFSITSLDLKQEKSKTPLTPIQLQEISACLKRNGEKMRKKRSNEGLPLSRLSDSSLLLLNSISPQEPTPEPTPESLKGCCVIS